MRQRTLSLLAHTARGLGVVAVFTGGLVAAVVLHANVPGFRRAGTEIANRAMAPVFEGKIIAGPIESLSVGAKSRARVKSALIVDPEGKKVIEAEGIDATINLRRLFSSLWAGTGPAVELENVRIRSADVALERDPDGKPTIARTFQPKANATTAASTAPTATSSTHAEPYLDIASVRIDHAKVHGGLVPTGLDGTSDQVLARVHLEHDVVRIDLDDGKATLLSPHLPNQSQPIVGAVKGVLSVTLPKGTATDVALAGHADLNGSIGAVPLVAHAQIDGDDVDATVDIAHVEVAPLQNAFAQLPFGRAVEAHARAHGKLPQLALDVRGRVGESDITATGSFDLREGHAFQLDADALHVDASAYGAPFTTDITTKVHAEGTVSGKGLGVLGSYRIKTEEGTAGGEKVPATTVAGKIEETRITAALAATEPGVELSGTGSMALGTFITDVDVTARSSNLRAITRVPSPVGGSASARVQGKINILAQTITATTSVHGDDVVFDAFKAGHVDATGQLHGPLKAPLLDVAFTADDMQVKSGAKPIEYPSASGKAQIAFVPSIAIVSASLDVGAKGMPNAIGASAANVTVHNGMVEARGVQLTGLGEPLELDARFGSGAWSIRAKSAGVDLHRVATMTGIKELKVLPEGTRAALDVDIHDGDGGATGHADIVVTSEKGKLLAGGIVAETHARIDKGHVAMTAKIASEGLGEVEIVDAQLDIRGRLDARSIERATGVVEIRGSLDLAQGGALLGGDSIEQMSGIARYEARIERGDPDALPAVRATAQTTGLDVTISEDPSKPSAHLAGIDLNAHVDWDGRTDDAEIALASWDAHGLLGHATAKAKVPLAAWATGAKKLTRRAIADLDVNAVAELPTRSVHDLPELLKLPPLRGKVGGRVTFEGEVAHPVVIVSARADGLRIERRGTAAAMANPLAPLAGVLEARWDGERGAITFALDEQLPPGMPPPPVDPRRKKRALGHLHGLVLVSDARMTDLLRGRAPTEMPWAASSEIEIQDLNLAALPIPEIGRGARQITGALSGRIKIRDLNRAGSFEAQAHVEDFGIGGATVQSLAIIAGGRDESLFVNAQVKDTASTATLQFASQSVKVKGLDVSWDPAKPSRLDYAVQNMRLGLVQPLVRRSISEIDGRINGTGSVTLDGQSQVFEGGLALTQTSLYVNTLGESITGLSATARFDKSGTFAIEDATGKLGTGTFTAKAHGRMKGFQFASGDAIITANNGLPIASEGANFASASGEVDLSAQMTGDGSELDVKAMVPRADITLPDRSPQQLQPLEADKTIAVGLRRRGELDTAAVRRGRGGTGTTRPPTTTTTTVTTKIEATLGQRVHLVGRGLDLTLGGKTYIQLAKELAMTGQIDLRAGTIEVHGRRFTVDHGVVTFPEGGDPANPTVVAAAYWDAPDRTRVWVEFAGPLKSGKLTLRSEPAYGKNEILSILLFGEPDPNMATASGSAGSGGDTSGATAVGTGFVAEDMNRILSEIDKNLDVETDTLSGNRARTKLGRTFFDQRLKVQIGYAPGTTYREPDTTYLFLNWQFIPKWSLVGTRGDQGTSILDVLFQHRY